MNGRPELLRASYDECRRVTRESHSNFVPCFRLLSGKRRRAMEALYAFMRHTDDLVDGKMPAAEASRALTRWRAEVAAALSGGDWPAGGNAAILPALADTVRQFAIPSDYLLAAIDGAEMDLSKNRYGTFEELEEYCYRVASVVGLACLRTWGYRGEDPSEAAQACGLAFQLTNILRDLREDYERGRVYLPQEDFERFGYPEETLVRGGYGEEFESLMRFEIERVEGYYHEATKLAAGLGWEGRRIFVMMIRVYYRLLKSIEAEPARVLSEHVHLGRWQPLAIMARTLLHPSARAVLP
ncbi:MAG: phytoene/squalene synthase family protein [Thermoguttaceae bacterium]